MKSIEKGNFVIFRSKNPSQTGQYWIGTYFKISVHSEDRHVVNCMGNKYYVEDDDLLDIVHVLKAGTKVKVSNTVWIVKSFVQDKVRLMNEKNAAEFSVPFTHLDVTNLGNTLFNQIYDQEQEKKKVDEELFDILIMLRFYKEESGEINIPADEAKTLIEKLTKRVNK